MGMLGLATRNGSTEKKKKPDELLSSVVRETSVPAAVELLRSNTQFTYPSGATWTMLVLAAADIDGLSKRHSRDEAKGSIIQLINSDQIKTVATAGMIEEEIFGIIPTAETLNRMSEFSLLTGAKYSWAVVWQDAGDLMIELAQDATFLQAREVAAGIMSLREAVGEQSWRDHSGLTGNPAAVPVADADADEIEAEATEDEDDNEPEPVYGDDEGDSIFDDGPDDEGVPFPSDELTVPDDGVDGSDREVEYEADDAEGYGYPLDAEADMDIDSIQDHGDEGGSAAGSVAAEPEPGYDDFDGDDSDAAADMAEADMAEADMAAADNAVLLADQQEVREVVARRFLSGELDLEVDLNEFNATFAVRAPVVQIQMPTGATAWLSDQVAQLTSQANADLSQLRLTHAEQLRHLHVTLMSQHAEQVIRAVATDREGSSFKALKDRAEQAHQQRLADKEQSIRDRKAGIHRTYEEHAAKLAQQAAIQAEMQYKERNRARMEREQIDAVAAIEREVENIYSHDQQEILRLRRSDAALKMQVGTTQVFEVLAERQTQFLTDEEARLAKWTAEIQRIIDENRKVDIAQHEALVEQQRNTDTVGSLRREQEALLERMRNEHAERVRRLEDELERTRRDTVTQMETRDQTWQHSLDREREQATTQTAKVSQLLREMEALEGSVARRYEARLEEAQADKRLYANELERAARAQKQLNWLLIALMVALTLLAVAAGFIGGTRLGG